MNSYISTRKARQIVEEFGITGNIPDVLSKAATRKDVVARYDPEERDKWQFNRNSLVLWLLDDAAHKRGVRAKSEKSTIYEVLQQDIADGNPSIGEIGFTMDGDQRAGFVRFIGVDEPPEGTIVPLANLGINPEIGYFDKREFTDVKSICEDGHE
jgi:hypothetical protein